MPSAPLHLLRADIYNGWNRPRIRHLYKDSVSGHLLKQELIRVFSAQYTSAYSRGRTGTYVSTYTSDKHTYSKSFGLEGLRDAFDNDPWTSYDASENPQLAYCLWGNVYNSGSYFGKWEALVGCLNFYQPTASDQPSPNRHRSLTHVKSATITVTECSVPAGAGQARVGILLSGSGGRPPALATIQAAPFAAVQSPGTYVVYLHAPAAAYANLVPYFENLVPPDQDGYEFDWRLNDYAVARLQLAKTLTLEYETEEEAQSAILEASP